MTIPSARDEVQEEDSLGSVAPDDSMPPEASQMDVVVSAAESPEKEEDSLGSVAPDDSMPPEASQMDVVFSAVESSEKASLESVSPDESMPLEASQMDVVVSAVESSEQGQPVRVGEEGNAALSEAEIGVAVYATFLKTLFKAMGLYMPEKCGEEMVLDAAKQFVVYHYAASLYDMREAVFAALRDEAEVMASIPEEYRAAIMHTRELVRTPGGCWPLSVTLRSKHIFGHRAVVKFLRRLPHLPESAKGASVYLPSGGLPKFGGESDPVENLERVGLALVLSLGDLEPGARAVVSPCLLDPVAARRGVEATPDALRQELDEFIKKDAIAWKDFGRDFRDCFSETSWRICARQFPSENLQSPPKRARPSVAVPANTAPVSSENCGPDGAAVTLHADDDGQRAYGALLAALFAEISAYPEPQDTWLDVKKQLLVYGHAAQLYEEQRGISAIVRGKSSNHEPSPNAANQGEEDVSPGEATISPTHRRAVEAARSKIIESLSSGGGQVKSKRMFGHDYTIRFHQPPKGLPVPRKTCVFLRERPQITADSQLRKTPSIFRDLVRFRSSKNPLQELEEHGLGIVITLTSYKPRAFLLISPLLEQFDLIEEHSAGSWADIQQSLKEHLNGLIAAESEAWRNFIQRHANTVSKDSLRIIQKVLKTCSPSAVTASPAAIHVAAAEALREREVASMARAEAEQRKREAQVALEMRRGELESFLELNQELLQATSVAEKARLAETSRATMHVNKFHVLKHRVKVDKRKLQRRALIAERTMKRLRNVLQRNRARVIQRIKAKSKMAATKAKEAAQALAAQVAAKLNAEVELAQSETATLFDRVIAAQDAEASVRAELAERWKEVVRLETANRALKSKADLAAHEVRRHSERATKLEGIVGEARNAVAAVRGELKTKSAEASKLAENCAAIQQEVKLAQSETATLRDQVVTLQTELANSVREKLQALAQLELKTDLVSQLTASNTDLRADAAAARAAEAATSARALVVETTAKAQIIAAENAQASARAELAEQQKEMASLEASNKAFKSKADLAVAEAFRHSALAAEKEGIAAEARRILTDVRVELQTKSAEANRLAESCVALRREVAIAQQAVAESHVVADEAERACAEARKAELQSRAEAQVKADTVLEVQVSNRLLRVELAEARQGEADAKARAQSMETAVSDAEKERQRISDELTAKLKEVQELQEYLKHLRDEVAQSEAKLAQSTVAATHAEEHKVAAEKYAAESRQDAIETRALLQVKSEEVSRLSAICAALQTSISTATEEVRQAQERVASAERAASEAAAGEAKAMGEMQQKAGIAAEIMNSNVELRADVAAAKEDAASAREGARIAGSRMKAAEEAAAEARESLSRAQRELATQTEAKHRLEAACLCLRETALAASALADKESSRADDAERSEAEAKLGEVRIRAELQVKTAEVARLEAACLAFRAEAVAARNKAQVAEDALLVQREHDPCIPEDNGDQNPTIDDLEEALGLADIQFPATESLIDSDHARPLKRSHCDDVTVSLGCKSDGGSLPPEQSRRRISNKGSDAAAAGFVVVPPKEQNVLGASVATPARHRRIAKSAAEDTPLGKHVEPVPLQTQVAALARKVASVA